MMDDFGLYASLRWQATELGRQTGLAIELVGDTLNPRLSPVQEIGLFRIAQEALTNVAKHAQASRATVSLIETGRVVRPAVRDDGVGFDPQVEREQRRRGWGLVTMAERAEALGGALHIESAPGQGTRVIVELSR